MIVYYSYLQINLWTRSTIKSVLKTLRSIWWKLQKNQINQKKIRTKNFKNWSFRTINIQSGHEKNEGGKIYFVAKEIVKANLDTGESFEFHWAGYKNKRQAGIGILIRVEPNIEIISSNINDARVMGIDLKINGFNIRVVNAYAPTETTGTISKETKLLFPLVKSNAKNSKTSKTYRSGWL